MILGFSLASYAVVANDAIQTLGTFLASNARRSWWVLWMYGSGILAATLLYAWWFNDGDVSYGRLEAIPRPEALSWVHLIPPLALLALTRWGAPVSTTFLLLTAFSPKGLGDMLSKSVLGYGVAFLAAIVIYLAVAWTVEKRFLETADQPAPAYWTALQWVSTGFLWTQWLVQDLANIFVYLPRKLAFEHLVGAIVLMSAIQMVTFYRRGGEIQRVVTSKTNTDDIRSATIVDFIYAVILAVFADWSRVPMSTTWVFIGLLAGRELALTLRLAVRSQADTLRIVFSDLGKATAGIAVSVVVASSLPWMLEAADRTSAVLAEEAMAAIQGAPALR